MFRKNIRPIGRPSSIAGLLGFFVVTVLIATVGCQPKSKRKGATSSDKTVFYTSMHGNVEGFDPARANDQYSAVAMGEIYEPLYQYSYLERPYKIELRTAAAMPTISEDGKTYEIKIKPGIYFSNDASFTEKRELVANDYIYAMKRIADVKVQSTGWWLLNNRIVGLNEFREKSKGKEATDYTLSVAGLSSPDKHTLRIQLKERYPQMIYALSMLYTSAVASEVVDRYGDDFFQHPVGTGAYQLKSWKRGHRIVLERNPNYRKELYPSVGEPGDAEKGLLADAGKPLPFVDEVVMQIITESQPMWLNFLKGNLDLAGVPKDNYSNAIDENGAVVQELRDKGIASWRHNVSDVGFVAFNMDDPIVGKNVHLRRAISLVYDTEKRIELFYNQRAIPAHGPIPPGLGGYDASFVNPYKANSIAMAKQEMVEAGYPEGKGLPPLTYEIVSSTTSRQMSEILVSELKQIGIKLNISSNTWSELGSKIDKRRAQMFGMAWRADYPDAENFLALFYGPNGSPGSNSSNYKNPEVDKLYEQTMTMPDGPERNKIYQRIARLIVNDVPWIFGFHRIGLTLQHGWVENYKPHGFSVGNFRYFRINNQRKSELKPKL